MKLSLCLSAALASAVLGALTPRTSLRPTAPTLCMVSPAITIAAGELITLSVSNPQSKTCEAMLSFTNDNFMPVNFEIKPQVCVGSQLAKFPVPQEVPNGEAFLLWTCAGNPAPTCLRVILTDGSEDVINIVSHQEALLTCTAYSTTLRTMVSSAPVTTSLASSDSISVSLSAGQEVSGTSTSAPVITSTWSAKSGFSVLATGTGGSTTVPAASASSTTPSLSSAVITGDARTMVSTLSASSALPSIVVTMVDPRSTHVGPSPTSSLSSGAVTAINSRSSSCSCSEN